jgi:hypothetical protein
MTDKLTDEYLEELSKIARSKFDPSAWGEYLSCFPSNEDNLFTVYSEYNSPPQLVSFPNIDKFKWIGINCQLFDTTLVETVNGKPTLENAFNGVTNQGVAHIVIETKAETFNLDKINPKPTFVCQYNNAVHCIYLLKKYLPRNPSGYSLYTYGCACERLESLIKGSYVYNCKALNPFASEVELLFHINKRYTFKELFDTSCLNEEELKRIREKGKKAQAEAGRLSAGKRKSKSLARIVNAIIAIKSKGGSPSQTTVAEITGLSRRTVLRHWGHIDIKKIL